MDYKNKYDMAIVCFVSAMLGMLLISSWVIIAANNSSRDCMITTRLGEVTHVRIGVYND
jgi:hypothetical protein